MSMVEPPESFVTIIVVGSVEPCLRYARTTSIPIALASNYDLNDGTTGELAISILNTGPHFDFDSIDGSG